MLKVPAYDPFAIAIMGFGVLFVVVLARQFCSGASATRRDQYSD